MREEKPDTQTVAPQKARSRSWLRAVGRLIFVYAFIPYLVIVALASVFQRRLMYAPTRVPAITPDMAKMPTGRAFAIQATMHDELRMNGWLVLAHGHPAKSLDAAHEELAAGRPVILYFPGNSGDRSHRAADCRELTSLGCDMVIFDYRGYAENAGSPSEARLAADARAIWNNVTTRRKVDPNRIILFGESLGGGVATRLAAELCADGKPPKGLILSSTFSSMTDVGRWHYGFLPVDFMLLDRYPSAQRIAKVTCPIIIMHGTADDIVPIELGRKLFDAAPERSANGTPKKFMEMKGVGHNGIPAGRLRDAVVPIRDGAM